MNIVAYCGLYYVRLCTCVHIKLYVHTMRCTCVHIKIVCTHGAVYMCTLHLCEYVTDLINILAVCRVIVGNVFVNVGVS